MRRTANNVTDANPAWRLGLSENVQAGVQPWCADSLSLGIIASVKVFSKFWHRLVLIFAIIFISGCAASRNSARSEQTEDEVWKCLGESLYESFWVDSNGNPRSH